LASSATETNRHFARLIAAIFWLRPSFRRSRLPPAGKLRRDKRGGRASLRHERRFDPHSASYTNPRCHGVL